jgi:DNA repair protein RadC
VLFVHNHPSGDPSPSDEDKQLTQRLLDVARLLGIRVLDHIIIGDGSYYSFFDEGMMVP